MARTSSSTADSRSADSRADVATFRIQDRDFSAPLDPREGDGFVVRSVPRAYRVDFPRGATPGETVAAVAAAAKHPLLLADSRVDAIHLRGIDRLRAVPHFAFEAREENKEMATVMKAVDFLERQHATRASMLIVVGGGIVQDVAAFAACMYKRGMPWTFVPTTLLAQGDSGIGSKSALNHAGTKNLLGLFSAPRRVVMDPGFLKSLDPMEQLSGLGEIFRLHITGGPDFLSAFEREFAAACDGSEPALGRLIAGALSVKRAVIEVDEFEVDLRRSLNYGHSFGHALEALVDYRVPHGVAVTIGMLVENELAVHRGILGRHDKDRMARAAGRLVPPACREELANVSLDHLLDLLRRDKKTEGNALKLVVPESIGRIRFIDLELDQATLSLIRGCVNAVVDAS
jgi:3-dehydroquinate synthase